MVRVLITGGAGFIAMHLANLLAVDHEVTLLDNRVPSWQLPSNLHFVRCSVLDARRFEKLLSGIEIVAHFAGFLGVAPTESFPIKTLDTNTIGTRNVLRACIASGVRRIVFSSSSEVYGEPSKVPISEASPTSPRSVYGVSKLAGEEYVRAYGKQYGLEHVVCRFFNAYGPGQSRQFVIPKMIYQAISSKEIFVYGNGKQVRSFCYVKDVANALKLIMFTSAAAGETINVGNPHEPVTVGELAHIIRDICCTDAKITTLPYSQSDRDPRREIRRRIPDISKLQRITGYKPRFRLAQGLESVVASMRRGASS